MTESKLAEIFAEHPAGVLSTADGQGNVNAAVFGSARLVGTDRIVLGLGDNRTLANLRQNPQAVLLFYTLGRMVFDSRGIRLYLQLEDLLQSGPLFSETVHDIEAKAGKMAARSITTVVRFKVSAIRPLIDLHSGEA